LEELIDFRSLAFERLIAFMEKEKQKKKKFTTLALAALLLLTIICSVGGRKE